MSGFSARLQEEPIRTTGATRWWQLGCASIPISARAHHGKGEGRTSSVPCSPGCSEQAETPRHPSRPWPHCRRPAEPAPPTPDNASLQVASRPQRAAFVLIVCPASRGREPLCSATPGARVPRVGFAPVDNVLRLRKTRTIPAPRSNKSIAPPDGRSPDICTPSRTGTPGANLALTVRAVGEALDGWGNGTTTGSRMRWSGRR